MVGADLESLVSSHEQSGLVVLLVLQQLDVTGSTLLPLFGLPVKSEKFGAHLEGLLLQLFVGLDLDLLSQADDWLEVYVGLSLGVLQGRTIVLAWQLAASKPRPSTHLIIALGLLLGGTRWLVSVVFLLLFLLWWAAAKHGEDGVSRGRFAFLCSGRLIRLLVLCLSLLRLVLACLFGCGGLFFLLLSHGLWRGRGSGVGLLLVCHGGRARCWEDGWLCRSRQGRDGRFIAVAKEEQKQEMLEDAGVVDVAVVVVVVVVVVHAERKQGRKKKDLTVGASTRFSLGLAQLSFLLPLAGSVEDDAQQALGGVGQVSD